MSGAVATGAGDVVIYDGLCSFCLRWVERLRRWDRRGLLEFMPLQAPEARDLSGRSTEELVHSMHFVRADGEVFTGAAAVRQALLHTRWRTLTRTISAVPGLMFVAEWVYVRVAANRSRFGCEGESCSID